MIRRILFLFCLLMSIFWMNSLSASSEKEIQQLIERGKEARHSKPDSALYFFHLAVNQARIDQNFSLLAEALFRQARTERKLNGISIEALKRYYQSLEIFEKIGNKKRQAQCLKDIGLCYKNSKEYASAMEYFFAEANVREELGDTLALGDASYHIGQMLKVFATIRLCHQLSMGCNQAVSFSE